MICVGNMCKAMCGVAAGSVGGAINLYWAAQGTDISDISAKFGAQQTVTASLGLIAAALLAKSVSNVPATTVWMLYSGLTVLHIFANVQCMRILEFHTFNAARLRMIFHEFWNQHSMDESNPTNATVTVASPSKIASREPLIFLPGFVSQLGKGPSISFGVPFNDVVDAMKTQPNVELLSRPYWLSVSERKSPWMGSKHVIKVALNARTTPRQQIQAYFDALVFREKIKHQGNELSLAREELDGGQSPPWYSFSKSCQEAGWNLDISSLASEGYEVTVDLGT